MRRKPTRARNNLSSREQTLRVRQPDASRGGGKDLSQARWVTGPNLRRMFNISAPTLWRWRKAGGFPVPKIINGRLYFAVDQIEAWMAAQPLAG